METIIYQNRLTAREPHNLYLLTAVETGIVGLAFLLLYFTGIIGSLMSSVYASMHTSDKALLKGMAISVSIVMLQSITESMLLARPRFAILTGILWGTYRRYAMLIERSRKP